MPKVYIWTSGHSVSLQRVSNTIASLIAKRGIETEVFTSPRIALDILQSALAGLVVMTFDPMLSLPYMYVAWELSIHRIPYTYYVTIDGKPQSSIPYWIIRDLEYVANSKYTKTMLETARAKVVDVVYHGVDVDKIQSYRELRDQYRSKLGVDKLMALYIATDRPRKCHNLLAMAIKHLEDKNTNVQFVVLTEPSGVGHYNNTDAIILTDYGRLSEKDYYGLIHASDVYVHASCSEGFGIPVLEALACGKLVVHPSYDPLNEITTESTSIRVPVDYVRYQRDEGGILFEHKLYNPANLAGAVEKAVATVREHGESIEKKAVKRAVKFNYANTFEKLINRLLDRYIYR